MTVAIEVREPRTGMPVRNDSWADWRRRWDGRPRTLRSRVRACPCCWAFGALELVAGRAVGVPCLSCGRVGS